MRVESVLRAQRPLVIGAAAVVPLVACAVLALFRDSVANTNAALALVLIIVAAAATGIRPAGIVAALSSAAWFDFFLTEPYNSFSISDRADIETAVLLVLVGAAVSEVALWGYRQQARASRERGYLAGVLGTAATVAAGRTSTSSLIDHVCGQIVEVLQIDDCRFDSGAGPALPTLSSDGTIVRDGRPINVERHGLPTDSEIALMVQNGGVVYGRFLLTAATRVVRGDSMITPAISVLSAVEGLKVVEPSLESLIVPITAVIIVALFSFQRMGTAAVGRLFGPVMIVWFVAIAACGIRGIAGHPEILTALSPTYALDFLVGDFSTGFFALAAVVLAVTGAEALYADMGHFGRRAITRAWLILVFPACILSYMGQGALILGDPDNVSSPFFLLVPDWGRLPVVLLATAATVIASQAVITGAYSVASQAAQLGYLPRLRIAHTSEETVGQIYVPWINWLLMVSVLTLVFAFQSSTALAYAFGMAVTGTITITTLLFFYVVRHQWGVPLWLVILGGGALLLVDLLFLAANLTKLVHGAWLPLLIGITAFTIMTTWQRGRELVTRQRERDEGSLRAFVDELHELEPPLPRIPGTAVFLNRGKESTPLAMRANVKHNRVLHEHVVIMSIETQPVPRVPIVERLVIDDLGYSDDGITHVSARFGYMDEPNVPGVLRLLEAAEIERPVDVDHASYFLSKIELRRGAEPTMARWRKQLFLATSRITADAAEYFGPPETTR